MDTSNQGKENEKGWEASGYSWEEMQTGIYDKILEEDPRFFEKKRRKRFLIWFWLLPALLGLALFFFFFEKTGKADAAGTEPHTPVEKPYSEPQTPPLEPQKSVASPFEKPSTALDSTSISQTKTLIYDNQAQKPGKPELKEAAGTREMETTDLLDTPGSLSSNEPDHWMPFSPISLRNPALEHQPLGLTPLLRQPSSPAASKAVSYALYAGGILSPFNYRGNSTAASLRNENTSALLGYVLGIEAHVPLDPAWDLMLGLERQSAIQRIDIETERIVDVELKDVLLSITHSATGNFISNQYGDTTVSGLERNRLIQYNDFEFLQLRAGLGRSWAQSNWIFTPSAGLAAGWLNKAEGRTAAADGAIIEYGAPEKLLAAFQFKTWLGMQVERRVSPHVALRLAYRFDKQWSNGSLEEDLILRPSFHLITLGVVGRW